MNSLYDYAAEGLLTATVDLVDDVLAVRMVQDVPFDPGQTDATTITGWVPDVVAVPLNNRRIVDRALCADPVEFNYLGAGGDFVTALIIYRTTDDLLVAYVDTRPDLMPFSIEVTEYLTFTWAQDEVVVL